MLRTDVASQQGFLSFPTPQADLFSEKVVRMKLYLDLRPESDFVEKWQGGAQYSNISRVSEERVVDRWSGVTIAAGNMHAAPAERILKRSYNTDLIIAR